MKRALLGSLLAAGLAATAYVPAQAQYYGYGQGLPPGSYQQSCGNYSMRGSVLSASCTNTSGRQVYSSIDVSRCANGTVANNNGYLTCANAGGGYYGNNGYGENGDRDDDNDGDNRGREHRHHGRGNGHAYGYGNGNGYAYGNPHNGSGSGYGYGYGYGLPPGSYQQSCTNLTMRGSVLSGSCTNYNGQPVYSSINVNQCQANGQPVRNDNGYLRC